MAEYANERYVLDKFQMTGKLAEVGQLVPYSNGNGYLREIVVMSSPNLEEVMSPVTLFGDTATGISEQDIGRGITLIAKLQSRHYTDRNGKKRWSVNMVGENVKLEGPMPVPEEQQTDPLASDPDDIPF